MPLWESVWPSPTKPADGLSMVCSSTPLLLNSCIKVSSVLAGVTLRFRLLVPEGAVICQ